ncbi:regulator of G-protein signaling domain-containing protein [Aspergillus ibericus CBS 121593]|uniref:Regulator of G protein signaling domain protein n=1 Tax=Aspergillus ibericus CBS 121593 TaxID=1448316 RepID=A0A395GSH7_9EURO|nr:regulator of G protein signaling domain protein [Aspergillus ibericus CBS 121593]RAK98379.1 regulator of G protein signaling domain protein [Aspergillus ibericus CBS 121593]
MLKKKTLHPPILFRHHTPSTTPELSPTTSSSDSESDEDMDSSGSRPLSLTVPGAFCSMRPSLDEVLANTAPAPYTLSAFMAYLSQNHCLETLEFTLEAKRYRETYDALSRQMNELPIVSDRPESQHLQMLWQRLLTAYILPGSPREINVSSEVRDDILRHTNFPIPPPPDCLNTAVKLVHDLMEESIFLPFLNAHASTAHVLPLSEPLFSHEDDITVISNSSLDEHAANRGRSKRRRQSPQSSKDMGSPVSVGSPSSHSGRSNFSLSAMTSMGKVGHRTSGQVSSTSGDSGSGALTDDSGSLQSSASAGEPMTPPTTPPSSDPHCMHLAHSPKRTDNPWKKMGLKLGFKKRSGHGGSGNQQFRLSGMDE